MGVWVNVWMNGQTPEAENKRKAQRKKESSLVSEKHSLHTRPKQHHAAQICISYSGKRLNSAKTTTTRPKNIDANCNACVWMSVR